MGQQQSTSTDQRTFRRTVVVAFAWLFTALAMLALLSAPDATHDEMFHSANIWCGHGERPPYCVGIRLDVDYPGATVNFSHPTCQRDTSIPLACPIEESGSSFRSINHGSLYPRVFYFTLSWFVVPSFDLSVIMTRAVSAMLIVLCLMVITMFLPLQHRRVVLLVLLTAFPTTGYYLLASINPSSWATFGVAFAWLPFHAALTTPSLTKTRRCSLLLMSLLTSVMAGGSRWDAVPFLLLTFGLAVWHAGWIKFPQKRIAFSVITSMALFGLLIVSDFIVPIHVQPSRFAGLLLFPPPDQASNLLFFSHYLLQGIPNALGALGTLPTSSRIPLLPVIQVINIAMLGLAIFITRDQKNRFQSLGSTIALLTMSAVAAAQTALIDSRDLFGPEPRYTLPLLAFAVGWWMFHGQLNISRHMKDYLRMATPVATGMFALMCFTVAERFVDIQTYGLRMIPEGSDHWWWSWMPVGPNIVLLLAITAMWHFLRSLTEIM